MTERYKLNNVVLSFPALFTPKTFEEGGNARFEASFLMDKDRPEVEEIRALIKATAIEKWNDKVPANIKKFDESKVCLRDGDDKAYDGYQDRMYLACASRTRPTVVNKDRTPILPEDGTIYAGCIVNAIVSFWAQDNKFGKRINCEVHGVQFVKDGERFGGGGVPLSADDFDEIEGDNDVAGDDWE